tara:strand:+ start:1100 stop:1522 length:423 start_codon:yes stop_codon:yes gene_type:complete
MSNPNNKLFTASTCIQKDSKNSFYLSGLQCTECGSIYLDKRLTCAKCFASNKFNEIKLSNTGKLYSYSIVHRSFPGIEVPYISAIVDLNGGGTIKGNLINIEPNPKCLSFDMNIKVIFEDALGRKDKDGNSYISYFFEPI